MKQFQKIIWLMMGSAFAVFVSAADFASACQRNYEEGNPVNLRDYCTKGAEQGDGFSNYILGNLYFEGIADTPLDRNKAAQFWHKAAALGIMEAQHNVGRLYQKGITVEQDYQQALAWYTKAAKQGDSYAMHNIGFFYQQGLGVEVDYLVAEKWYTEAALLGLPNSQYNLAVMYFNGEELEQDKIKAYAWIALAVEREFTPARDDINTVEKSLDAQEKLTAMQLAAKWRSTP